MSSLECANVLCCGMVEPCISANDMVGWLCGWWREYAEGRSSLARGVSADLRLVVLEGVAAYPAWLGTGARNEARAVRKQPGVSRGAPRRCALVGGHVLGPLKRMHRG